MDDSTDRDLFMQALGRTLPTLGVSLDARAYDLLFAHYRAVVETNRVMNLTRITSPEDAAIKHVADCLAVLPWAQGAGLSTPLRVLDVGTGAGFPAIPVTVARPEWNVTAMDGTRKKVDFVRRVGEQLMLTNLTTIHARADKNAPSGDFDLVFARAVAHLDPLLRWLAPWARLGGRLVVWKSAQIGEEELLGGKRLSKSLQLTEEPPFSYELPDVQCAMRRQLQLYRTSQ